MLPTALGMEDIARRTMVRANLLHDDAGASLTKVMDPLEAITPSTIADLACRYLREEQARAVLLVPERPPRRRTTSVSRAARPDRTRRAPAPHGEESGADSSDEEDEGPSREICSRWRPRPGWAPR